MFKHFFKKSNDDDIFETVDPIVEQRRNEKFSKPLIYDEEFKKEYDAIQPEMDVIRAIVDARTSQNMTQKELAERTGINQADISKLENGTRNPSVNLLKRLADAEMVLVRGSKDNVKPTQNDQATVDFVDIEFCV